MRRGFQGLSAQVQTVLVQQPFSGHVFVFRERKNLSLHVPGQTNRRRQIAESDCCCCVAFFTTSKSIFFASERCFRAFIFVRPGSSFQFRKMR